ncbi:AlpA family transcriptional regulator [Bradyrhizobium sp. CIR3A]|uniref:helix-turn-helix transcriptional regulator n=1 Tax=Bradyrhizobium sp. CIR3A TaxID=2663838 RepID=UPI001606367C|nr:AlpA family phage regulatory protein [Bradyrhizobium sp. CIR3A]MBB4258071.1 putative DNA-binding transcriptional regulator AlpA [Bradyrhizobium sp. CIR3A]
MAEPIACKFYTSAEVSAKAPFSDLSQWRLEQVGRFPKRIKITQRKIVWRKDEVDAWEADPEGYRAPSLEAAHG